MKKVISLTIIMLLALTTISYASVAHTAHVSSHSSVHTISRASSTIKSTVSGAKTYTTPKSFTSKYNSSNIKTEKVVSEPKNYTNYSTSNIFRPNFWTAMWAFQCMHDNTEQVTEQDIAKELEERGYTQEEIQEILQEGEQAKEEAQKQEDEENKLFTYIGIGIAVSSLIILFVVLGIYTIKF